MSDTFQNDPLEQAQRAFNPFQRMVSQFTQTFGPRPAPRAPPTIEQPDQTQPPDPLRTAANNFLPPGSPYPPKRAFQPYIPTAAQRPPSQWGQAEEFPALPEPFEVPHLARGLGNWFSQNGSQNVALLASMMGPNADTFLKSYGQAKELQGKLALEQLRLRTAQMADTLEQESFRYADVIASHGALNQTLDPKKMFKPVDGKSLMTDLYETAVEIGDYGKPGSLGSLIESGATAKEVFDFLHMRDARTRDVQKLKQALSESDAEDARLMGTQPSQAQAQPSPAAAEAGGYLGVDPNFMATPPATGGAPAPTAPAAPKLAGGEGGEAAGPAMTLVPGPDGTMVPASTPGTGADSGAPIDALKHQIMTGNKPPTEWIKAHPKAFNEAVDRATEANNTIEKIIRNPPKDTRKILPMVRALDADMANDVDSVANYKDPASGGVSGTGASLGSPASQYGNMIRRLVTLIDPSWKQSYYQDQDTFRKNVQVQATLARTKDLAPLANQLAGDLIALQKKYGLGALQDNLGGLFQKLGNAPEYVRLRSDLTAYNQAYNTVVTMGHNTITGVKLQMQELDPWAPIASYRATLQGHMVGVWGMIQGQMDRWQSIGGREDNMPSGDTRNSREAFKTIRDMSKWDIVSGAMPYDPANSDNDILVKKAGPWGPAGQYYWTGAFPQYRDDPRNWKRVD